MIKTSLKPIFLLSILGFFLAGCSRLPGFMTSPTPSPVLAPFTIQENDQDLGSTQIARALQNGIPISCTVVKSDENKRMSLMMKQGKVLFSGNTFVTNGNNGNLISDSSVVYVWEDGARTGWKSTLPTQEDLPVVLEQVKKNNFTIPDPTNPNNIAQLEDQGYTITCQETEVIDSVFVPPTEIRFTDISTQVRAAITTKN